jgi:hypothetical protein
VITNNLWDINGETVTVVKKDKLLNHLNNSKKINMEADKLGGYTVKEWRQMIEDKVADIYEVLEFVKPNIFEENAQNKEACKESVTEELYT